MNPEHVSTFSASPNPVPGAAGRLRQTVGLPVIFLYMGSVTQCINTSECASQCFVHGLLYDLLLIMSILLPFTSLLS